MRKSVGGCGLGLEYELPQVSKTHRQSQFALADDRTCRRMGMVWLRECLWRHGCRWVVSSGEAVGGGASVVAVSVCCSLRGAFDVQQAVVKCGSNNKQHYKRQVARFLLAAFCWLLSDYNHHDKYSIYHVPRPLVGCLTMASRKPPPTPPPPLAHPFDVAFTAPHQPPAGDGGESEWGREREREWEWKW